MIVNRAGRHPHEVALLSACFFYGLIGITAYGRVSTPTVQALGAFAGYLFFGSILFGSAVALMGVFWPFKGVQGPLVEQGGLLILAAFWFGYCVAVVHNAGLRGVGFVLVTGGFAVANVYRAVWNIPRENRQIAAAAAKLGMLDELRGDT